MTQRTKSLKLGVIAMLPHLVTTVVLTMGSMAVLGIPFDMSTVLFASIILEIVSMIPFTSYITFNNLISNAAALTQP